MKLPLTYTAIAVVIVALAILRAVSEKRPRMRRPFDALAKVEVVSIALLLASLVVVGVLQILLRNLFHTGFLWADPFMRHVVLWLGALGASLATSRARHINIDVFSRMLPPKLKRFRGVVVFLATAAAAFVLGIAALRLVVDEREFGEMAFLGLHTWVLQTVLPFAFFMIAYRSILNMLLGRTESGGELDAELQ